MSDYAQIDEKLQKHFEDDNIRFKEINQKLDSILEVMSAFRLGWKGATGIVGFLVALGTLVILGGKIIGK